MLLAAEHLAQVDDDDDNDNDDNDDNDDDNDPGGAPPPRARMAECRAQCAARTPDTAPSPGTGLNTL